jgi:hypothetical protein
MDEPLQKFVVLVPLRFNDGTEVPSDVIVDFQEKLFLLGGGFTIAGTVEGAYLMADGKKQIDHSISYWIGVPDSEIEQLRTIVSDLGNTLGQECMYLEHTGSKIEFVPPSRKGGKEK